MGDAFGDNGLKEIIPIKEYLNSPVIIDEFLEGVAEGTKRAMTRKAAAAAKAGQNSADGGLVNELRKLLKEGK